MMFQRMQMLDANTAGHYRQQYANETCQKPAFLREALPLP
jgi:hypothetical protein